MIRVLIFGDPPTNGRRAIQVIPYPQCKLSMAYYRRQTSSIPNPTLSGLHAMVNGLPFVFIGLGKIARSNTSDQEKGSIQMRAILIRNLFLFRYDSIDRVRYFPCHPFSVIIIKQRIRRVLIRRLCIHLNLRDRINLRPYALNGGQGISIGCVGLLPFLISGKGTTPSNGNASSNTTSGCHGCHRRNRSNFLYGKFGGRVMGEFSIV